MLFETSNRGINNIIFAFEQNLQYNDSLTKSFSTLIVNPMFFRNDAPYEGLT
jgi:isocitrate dehydrogenase kinase/phosphatase